MPHWQLRWNDGETTTAATYAEMRAQVAKCYPRAVSGDPRAGEHSAVIFYFPWGKQSYTNDHCVCRVHRVSGPVPVSKG